MKVILLKNIPKIGQKGDVKDLKEGFVRNSLLPSGAVKIATAGELNNLKHQNKLEEEYQNAETAKIIDIFKKLDGQIVELSEKKNEKGHLFAKVDKDKVITAVKNNLNIQLMSDWVEFEPKKETGDFPVSLNHESFSKSFVVRII